MWEFGLKNKVIMMSDNYRLKSYSRDAVGSFN